jgi:hypothetical protein
MAFVRASGFPKFANLALNSVSQDKSSCRGDPQETTSFSSPYLILVGIFLVLTPVTCGKRVLVGLGNHSAAVITLDIELNQRKSAFTTTCHTYVHDDGYLHDVLGTKVQWKCEKICVGILNLPGVFFFPTSLRVNHEKNTNVNSPTWRKTRISKFHPSIGNAWPDARCG